MAIREIVTIPEPVLRRKARKVTDFGTKLQTLIDDMVETMRAAPGVGLAAPQVDVPLRVIVVEFADENEEEGEESIPPKLYTLVNPEITRPSKELFTGVEGCLSIPDLVGEVERPISVTLKGLTRQGQPTRIKAYGWLARIFQHEVDHLNGVLFTDRASSVWQPEEGTTQVVAAD
ncbi:MAG: peptide deformylase [Anaerolineales bacterium]|jgi:peptide deformylase